MSPGYSFTPLFYGEFLWALARPKRVPCFLGAPIILGRTAPCLQSDVLGSLLPAFLFMVSFKNKVSWDLFPDIRWDYFGGRLSSSFYRGGEN